MPHVDDLRHQIDLYALPDDDALELFRIVRGDRVPSVELRDSLSSNYALGRPPRRIEGRSAALHMGLSMYELASQAEQTARLFPKIGRYIARLELGGGCGFNLAPTAQAGHWTVWGRPDQLLAAVADIYPW
jgi:hypothetical protein